MQPGKEQHFNGYAGRRDRDQDGQGLIKCREDQAQAAKQLKDAHHYAGLFLKLPLASCSGFVRSLRLGNVPISLS